MVNRAGGVVERFTLIPGKCEEILPTFPADHFDAIVTDPPAGIGFMGKEWDKNKGGRDSWIRWMCGIAEECLRVLKPGAYALVWTLPRVSHWTATAWEDAGFELRESISHLFGSGFPKSLDVSKAIDRAANAEREVIGRYQPPNGKGWNLSSDESLPGYSGGYGLRSDSLDVTTPTTDAAKQWDGWGTALKPCREDWLLFRKPFTGTVAANVLQRGTGGLNIDGCRVPFQNDGDKAESEGKNQHAGYANTNSNQDSYSGGYGPRTNYNGGKGRFPGNVTHDGSDEVIEEFTKYGMTLSSGGVGSKAGAEMVYNGGWCNDPNRSNAGGLKDYGTPARFFYCAKASPQDRNEGLENFPDVPGGFTSNTSGQHITRRDGGAPGPTKNNHPTVKNTTLMRWLCRLITPPGGKILDPFAGSGSTGKGAMLEGFGFVGIDDESECSIEVAQARIQFAVGVVDEEARRQKERDAQMSLFDALSGSRA